MVAYLMKVRPFKSELSNTSSVVDEILIILATGFFMVYYFYPFLPDAEYKMVGWVIIGLVLLSVIKNFGIVAVEGFKSARAGIHEVFIKPDLHKVERMSTEEMVARKTLEA